MTSALPPCSICVTSHKPMRVSKEGYTVCDPCITEWVTRYGEPSTGKSSKNRAEATAAKTNICVETLNSGIWVAMPKNPLASHYKDRMQHT